MIRSFSTQFSILLFALSPAILGFGKPVVAQAPAKSSAANLVPDGTTVYLELANVEQLIDTVFDHPLRSKIEALAPYQQAVKSKQYKQAMLGLEMFENLIGMPWREAITTFAADGVAVAIDLDDEAIAVIVDGKDAESMRMFRDRLIGFAAMDKNRKLEHVEYRGIKAHRVGEARLAVHNDRFLVTNNSDFGKAILDAMLDGPKAALATKPRFQTALKARDPKATVWAFADTTAIRDSGVADDFYHSQINNPVVELLVGGVQSCLQHTPYTTGNLTVATEKIALKLSMPHKNDWIPEEREYFFGPDGNGRGPAVPEVGETLMTLSTYRDFSEMWLRAPDLYNADINDEFAKADAGLTTFFSGKDFGEDILGEIESPVGLVVVRQDFAGKLPQPAIKLPAFGLVTTMKDPETMTREMRRTFQNLIGFFSVVGAMEGFGQLDQDMEKTSEGAQFVMGRFVVEDDKRETTEGPIVFNFSPTVGFLGNRMVVASTTELAKKLTLAPAVNPTHIDDNTQVSVQANALRKTLTDNREQLIAQNMLEDGNSREEAETQIDLLMEFIGYFRDANVRLGQSKNKLEVEFGIGIGDAS